jgi:group I intron endonuclease
MSFYIYLIHNIINNKVYVGKTSDPSKRWLKHLKVSSGKRQKEKFYIHRAISKYGADNFVFSIVQQLNTEQELGLAETYWIEHFQSKNNKYGYNLTEGGEGVSGRVVSEATRQKQREKATGRKHTEETKDLLSQINLGKMPTNIEQLKTMHIGKPLSDEHCEKISQARQGMIFTEEHRGNMSKVRVGKNTGPENHFYGRTHTEEAKDKSRGENNKHAKLIATQVIEIRQKYNTGNYTQQELADEYGISRRAVSHILNGSTWAHLLEK